MSKHLPSFAIVVSRFNEPVTEKLLEGALAYLKEKGVSSDQVTVQWVPGAVEIPLTAQAYAKKAHIDSVICLGAVIRGETAHYDVVCQQVAWGCQHVALQFNKPVIFGVLTTENADQAFDRVGGAHGHKGRDAASTAMSMVSLLQDI